jgi:hypothetical protein
VIAILDLLEAEGRAWRAALARLNVSLALFAVAVVLLLAGVALLVWGLYQGLAAALGPAGGALVAGAITTMLGGTILWAARQAMR